MANYSSISQSSNLSTISSVSRSTTSRGPLRADLSMESFGQSNITGRSSKVSNNPGKRNCNRFEEINKAFSHCEETISDYAIKKLIHECVREASLNEDQALTQSTAKKLRMLLTGHEVEKYLHLPNNSNDVNEKMTLLGITDLPKSRLNYEEKLDIKRLVENKLRDKTTAFLARFVEMGGNMEELIKKSDIKGRHQISEVFETDLIQWKEKIEQECAEYEKDVLEYRQNLSEWINLKYGDLNDIQLKKAESLLVKIQVSEAQAKITKLNCILKMFKDTPFTLDAYQMISSSLDNRIIEMEEEIQRKESTKKLYDDLSGTEYEQVVQKYSELCKAIEKKKRFMEDLYG